MNVAKIQSDGKAKDYEKTKTRHNTPHDMVNIVAAKKAQDVANVNYKYSLHHYTYLPDAMDLELSKNMMHIQSDVSDVYSTRQSPIQGGGPVREPTAWGTHSCLPLSL